MTEPAEFMQRVDAKLDHAQATLDQHGRYLLELRALVTPAELAPMTKADLLATRADLKADLLATRADLKADILATRADLDAVVRRLTWRFAAMVAVTVLAVLVLRLLAEP